LVLYTDGLLEAVDGEQEDQLKFLVDHLRGNHVFDKPRMEEVFFEGEPDAEQDDDKCLVWISLKEGAAE